MRFSENPYECEAFVTTVAAVTSAHISLCQWVYGQVPKPSRPAYKDEACTRWQRILSEFTEKQLGTGRGSDPLRANSSCFPRCSICAEELFRLKTCQTHTHIQSAWLGMHTIDPKPPSRQGAPTSQHCADIICAQGRPAATRPRQSADSTSAAGISSGREVFSTFQTVYLLQSVLEVAYGASVTIG